MRTMVPPCAFIMEYNGLDCCAGQTEGRRYDDWVWKDDYGFLDLIWRV